MNVLLAIDPGVTTGVALKVGEDRKTTNLKSDVELFEFILMADEVVYENYAGQIISKYGLHTVRLVGGIIALCWYLKKPCTRHAPVDRYPFMDKAKLILTHQHTQHELDALAHLLRYEHDQQRKSKNRRGMVTDAR